ncbi:TetR/AcrR family transcriptional regulator [Pseudomonas cavernae]|uniref:TetR/AcrR family transcriptional regulator n=1 Tax=Pseudomonas cavernae TaxID=2320867 RepID=A0A385Z0E7_9PSED|nr:TetR/AcrR family transcriptional regulator [Pseudomonas cavernae]AYC32040.1 TetR/AcrR family transcriptional regulator [Pseudomonas cavernae]
MADLSPKALKTRAGLLDAARSELLEQGGGLEVGRVAERAGVSVGLIYRYFNSRAGLLAAVAEDFYDRYQEQVMAADPLPDAADWSSREEQRTRRAVDFVYAEPLAPLVLVSLAREPEVAALEAQRTAENVRQGADNIRRGQAAGQLNAGLDPELVSAMILGGMHQALLEALGRNPRPAAEQLARQLWHFIRGALAPL